MINEKRTYVIPLRREFNKAPRYKRSKKAIKALREFIIKHMKTEKVVIDILLNEYVWSKGIKNPPAKVKVNAIPKDNYVYVELAELTTNLNRKKQRIESEKQEVEKKKEKLKPQGNQLENLIKKEKKQEDNKEENNKGQETDNKNDKNPETMIKEKNKTTKEIKETETKDKEKNKK